MAGTQILVSSLLRRSQQGRAYRSFSHIANRAQLTSASPRLVATSQRNASSMREVLASLWQSSRGWGKFFPDEPGSQEKASPQGSEKEKAGGGGSGGGGGGGGGGGRKKPPPPVISPLQMGLLVAGLGMVAFALSMGEEEKRHAKEITFQEFKQSLLAQGVVEKVKVVNKMYVLVYTKDALSSPVVGVPSSLSGVPPSSNTYNTSANGLNVNLNASATAAPKPPAPFASLFGSAPPHTHNAPAQGTQSEGMESGLRVEPSAPVSGSIPRRKLAQYHFVIASVEGFERQLEDAQRELGIPSRSFVPVQHTHETSITTKDVLYLASTLLPIAFLVYLFRNGPTGMGGKGGKGIFSIGKANITVVRPGESKVTFNDVAGLDEAKGEVMEFVKFLKNPELFNKLGAKIPKGALLVGPPGTGKTLLAKATAGEASVPFFSLSGSDFIEMFVGVGASRVRDLFAQAREEAPCIVFIDEIDAVGRARAKGGWGGGNEERENTLNQLLVEMDGFKSHEGVVVLAGTNRADTLDAALLRPGRFDRQITIDKPDIKGRTQILKVHLKPLKIGDLDPEDLSSRVAALTPGMAGADLANICNEAAIIAARTDKPNIELKDFEAAIDRVIGGLEKRNSAMTKHEKTLVAYHEAGHAVVGWFLEHADPLLKVTVVPRGSGALGFAQYLPKELPLYQTQQLDDMMCMALGGRASEQTFFGKISTGASDDLRKVTNIAYGQVAVYGMSERLGNISYENNQQSAQKPYSEATSQAIDEEVGKIIKKNYERALEMVKQYRNLVQQLAEKLLEVETISHDGLVAILGQRPFASDTYREFLQKSKEAIRKATDKKADVKVDHSNIPGEPVPV